MHVKRREEEMCEKEEAFLMLKSSFWGIANWANISLSFLHNGKDKSHLIDYLLLCTGAFFPFVPAIIFRASLNILNS